MDQRVKKMWIKALESGKYKQTRGNLASRLDDEKRPTERSGFCCLGVLCDLYEKEKKVESIDFSNFVPPKEVLLWAGIDDLSTSEVKLPGLKDKYGNDAHLVLLNDGRKYNFSKIAQVIREKL